MINDLQGLKQKTKAEIKINKIPLTTHTQLDIIYIAADSTAEYRRGATIRKPATAL